MSEQDTRRIQTKDNERPNQNGKIPTVPDKANVGRLNKLWYITLAVPPLISWIIYIFFAREWNLDRSIHWFPMSIMATIISITILVLWKKWWLFNKITPFNTLIFGIAIIGGTIAFLLPLAIAGEFAKDSESTTLRQMLLYTTGGLLGVITLSETRRKNDEEIKKNRQDKQKNKKDHIRQVHAERRSRYAKAIEQLADEKAAIRLGGIYTLVGLVDEWLADKSIKDEDDRRKEGQVIINNLCSYIRSPFQEADYLLKNTNRHIFIEKTVHSDDENILGKSPDRDEDLSIDIKLKEESEIRKSIIQEIVQRINKEKNNNNSQCMQGMQEISWSDLNYDFSNAHFFYEFNIKNTYWAGDLNLSDSRFTRNVCLTGATVTSGANTTGMRFGKISIECSTPFKNISPTWDAAFLGVTFTSNSIFSDVEFTENSLFIDSDFKKTARFEGAEFAEPFCFSDIKFEHMTYFNEAIFRDVAIFENVCFGNESYFEGSIFRGAADFKKSTFKKEASFKESIFDCRFKHYFPESKYLILGKVTPNLSNTFTTDNSIPVGSRIGYSKTWDKDKKKYGRVSKPAEPLEHSDEEKEKPAE